MVRMPANALKHRGLAAPDAQEMAPTAQHLLIRFLTGVKTLVEVETSFATTAPYRYKTFVEGWNRVCLHAGLEEAKDDATVETIGSLYSLLY